jgi:hypothetical protein
MRIGASIILTMAVMTIGTLLPPSAYAGGGHHGFGHGFHHDYGSYFGFDFRYSPYPYPYGYPYYAPVYVTSAQPPPTVVYRERAQIISREKVASCREYTKKIVIDGKEARAYGTACLQNDGSWRIVN